MGKLKAGLARIDITPPVGGPMQGYAARTHGSEGIHDPLYAAALVLDDGCTKLAILSCDLIGMPQERTDTIRKMASERTGIPEKNIMICCSHTHGGPSMREEGYIPGDPVWLKVLEKQLAGLVQLGMNDLNGAKIGCDSGEARICVNRREWRDGKVVIGANPDGPIDPELVVMKIESPEGAPRGVLFNFSCHCTTLGGDNYLLTADYVGYARQFIERFLGSERSISMFVNGAGGNINPHPRGTFDWADRHGTTLGAETVKTLVGIETTDEAELSSAVRTIQLPLQPPPDLEILKEEKKKLEEQAANLEKGKPMPPSLRANLIWVGEMISRIENNRVQKSMSVEIQAFRIGDIGIIALPGEVFCEIGMAIKKQSKFRKTIIAGFSNGSVGYIPTAKGIEEGGYEPDISRRYGTEQHFAPGVEEAIVTQSVDLLNNEL